MDKGERIIPGNGAGVRERLGWADCPTAWTSGGDVSKLLRLEKIPGGPVARPLSQSQSGFLGGRALGQWWGARKRDPARRGSWLQLEVDRKVDAVLSGPAGNTGVGRIGT